MIEIKYNGGSSFNIISQHDSLSINPDSDLNTKNHNLKNSIQMVSENAFLAEDKENKLVISTPGEYEVGDFSILGFASKKFSLDKENKERVVNYSIEAEDIRIGFLGNISPDLTDNELESLGVVDVLLIPISGNNEFINSKQAAKLTRTIEPKTVIITNYDANNSMDFANELGLEMEEVTSYKIKKLSDLPESLKIVKITN